MEFYYGLVIGLLAGCLLTIILLFGIACASINKKGDGEK
jgi:hypothetical protein